MEVAERHLTTQKNYAFFCCSDMHISGVNMSALLKAVQTANQPRPVVLSLTFKW